MVAWLDRQGDPETAIKAALLPPARTARAEAASVQERDQIDQKIGKLLDFGEI